MKRICFYLLFMILFAPAMQAQDDVKILKKEFRTDRKEGFKEAWKSVEAGNDYFEKGKGFLVLARDHYLFANQYNPDNAVLNYRIGVCYLYTDDKYEAIRFLVRAYELNPEVSRDIRYLLGRAYHQVLEFDKARDQYLLFSQSLTPEESKEFRDEVEKLIMECKYGKELVQNPVRLIIQDLGPEVNSEFDDYNPVFASGDTALFFTSRKPWGKKPDRSEIDNKFLEDIYVSRIHDGNFLQAVRLGKPFNSDHNEAIVGISPDGTELFIYKGEVEGGDILISRLKPEKGTWKKPESLKGKLKSEARETSACLSPDGSELYFISDNPKTSNGGKDIYVTRIDAKGKWQEPENLGRLINTPYDEEGIFISPDGRYMYFSSMGHNSMGGFDIFRSERSEVGNWSEPVNMGYPINSPDDELFYITDKTGRFGYYSAIRQEGMGAKDIYKVIFLGAEKEMLTATRDTLIAGPALSPKKGFFTLPVAMSLDTAYVISGVVRDTMGRDTTVVARISFINAESGVVEATAMSLSGGKYTVRLEHARPYGVEINATGYLYFLDVMDLSSATGDDVINQDFYLQRIEVGTKVVLENIYFETGKAVLTPASYNSIDQVLRFLENNPSVELEISGHTDNTGSYKVNAKLSEARAKAVVDYLVGRGISAGRLQYKGYADTQPIATNDTPDGKEKNRRVEFKVISK